MRALSYLAAAAPVIELIAGTPGYYVTYMRIYGYTPQVVYAGDTPGHLTLLFQK